MLLLTAGCSISCLIALINAAVQTCNRASWAAVKL
jgi:hypothetical protein